MQRDLKRTVILFAGELADARIRGRCDQRLRTVPRRFEEHVTALMDEVFDEEGFAGPVGDIEKDDPVRSRGRE